MKSFATNLLLVFILVTLHATTGQSQTNLDTIPPVVTCINGFSAPVITSSSTTAVAVSSLIQSASDNTTPTNQLKYGIRKTGTGTGFPYAPNNPQEGVDSLQFTCQDIPTWATSDLEYVEVWAKDAAGNTSKCETFIQISASLCVCAPCGQNKILSIIKREDQEPVVGCSFDLSGVFWNNNFLDSLNGTYLHDFSSPLPLGANASVTPKLNQDPRNGVSTFDLLLISRHILGLEPFNSPYKMIAADVNRSNTVTSFDIVETRKMVLGVYSEFPNNTSWRFVRKVQVFTNPQNPFLDTLQESYLLTQVNAQQVANRTFVGIKIGDINLSAEPNFNAEADDRSVGTLTFEVTAPNNGTVTKGDIITLNINALEAQAGYQFTLDLDGLEVVEVLPGQDMTTDNFAVFDGALTTSADGTRGSFAVRFRATRTGRLSDMVHVSSRITRAEGFTPQGDVLDIVLRWEDAEVLQNNDLAVRQNTPNPWGEATTINFNVQKNDHVTLNVYDVTGRLVHTQAGDYAGGRNAFVLRKEQLGGASGVLYYTVASSTGTVTRSMVVR
jgi:hypothetical protein